MLGRRWLAVPCSWLCSSREYYAFDFGHFSIKGHAKAAAVAWAAMQHDGMIPRTG